MLSNKLEVNDKLAIIKEEYQISINDELREDVNIMCNLGQGIEDEAIAIGEARGIAIGESRGIAIGESRGIAIGESRREARGIRCLVDILMELETPTDIIIDKIMQKYSLSEAKAKEFLP